MKPLAMEIQFLLFLHLFNPIPLTKEKKTEREREREGEILNYKEFKANRSCSVNKTSEAGDCVSFPDSITLIPSLYARYLLT